MEMMAKAAAQHTNNSIKIVKKNHANAS